MKRTRIILLMMLGLAIGLNTSAQTIVTGTNLNIGNGNTLDGNRGNAIGTDHWLGGFHSLAVGNNDTIMNGSNSSITLGSSNRIGGLMSMTIGTSIKIEGNRSVGIGHDIRLTGSSGCMAIGNGIMGSGSNPNLFLENNSSNCLMIGLHSTKPTLTVSPSPNDYPHGNLISNRTGKVAIGNVPVPDIAAKLHICSDSDEDASLFLQPLGKNGECAYIKFIDNDHQIMVEQNGMMHLLANNGLLRIVSRNANLSNSIFTLGSPGDLKLSLYASDSPALYSNVIRDNGNYTRQRPGSSFAIEFTNSAMCFRTAVNQDPRGTVITNWQDPLLLKTNGNIILTGKVGINTENTTANYALAIDGGLITTKVFIQDVENWPDYVFDDNYRLMSLKNLQTFISENHHLPNLPSESEVTTSGYDIAEVQSALLQKIEELTLYTLQQQEEIEALKKMVEELKGK